MLWVNQKLHFKDITFLDDFSRKCWIYLLKNKSDVYDKFIEFYKLTSNLYNIPTKTFKSDNGTEYIINFKIINFKIPDELFFNKPVDISHSRVFSCKAFFFNNHKTNKFENNSKQGIFFGYLENSSGYRILDIFTSSIITARDVYFMEDIPGTIDTSFFSSKTIDSIFIYSNRLKGKVPIYNRQILMLIIIIILMIIILMKIITL